MSESSCSNTTCSKWIWFSLSLPKPTLPSDVSYVNELKCHSPSNSSQKFGLVLNHFSLTPPYIQPTNQSCQSYLMIISQSLLTLTLLVEFMVITHLEFFTVQPPMLPDCCLGSPPYIALQTIWVLSLKFRSGQVTFLLLTLPRLVIVY